MWMDIKVVDTDCYIEGLIFFVKFVLYVRHVDVSRAEILFQG